MSEQKFDLTIRCAASKIGVLMQLLANEEGIECSGNIIRVEEGEPKPSFHRASRAKGAGDTVEVLNTLLHKKGIGKLLLLEEAKIACRNNGLSPNSASPRLSYFTRVGVVKLVRNGKYVVEKLLPTEELKKLNREEERKVMS